MTTNNTRIALGMLCIFIVAGASLMADQVPAWALEYMDCGQTPLSQFLQVGPFAYPDRIEIQYFASANKLKDLHESFQRTYPSCKLTPLMGFITALQLMEYPVNPLEKNAVYSQTLSILARIADHFPNAKLPFDLRSDQAYYPRGTLIAPAALMRISEVHISWAADANPLDAESHYTAARQAWAGVVKHFPHAPANGEQLFAANALAKLLSFSACLAGGPPSCKIRATDAAHFAKIALRKYSNMAYDDGHYCGSLHPQALFALARVATDAEESCEYLQRILREHGEETFYACETDAGGAIGYSALDMMQDRCREAHACVDCFGKVVADKAISHDWRGRAQYKLAVYYQATLQDYRRAIQEYQILADQFGDVLEDDEDDDRFTQPGLGSIARERIGSLQQYLNSSPAPLKQ